MEYVPKANDLCEWGAGLGGAPAIVRITGAESDEGWPAVVVSSGSYAGKGVADVGSEVEALAIKPLRPTAAGQRVRALDGWPYPTPGVVVCVQAPFATVRWDGCDGHLYCASLVRIADAPASAWVPKVGERVTFAVSGKRGAPHDAEAVIAGCDKERGEPWYRFTETVKGAMGRCASDMAPVADRDVKPASAHHKLCGCFACVAADADEPAAPASTCSSPWHAQPCRCESGWVRGKETEPVPRETWAARLKSGEWFTYAERHAGACERLYIVGTDKRTLHPTPAGAVALWRARR